MFAARRRAETGEGQLTACWARSRGGRPRSGGSEIVTDAAISLITGFLLRTQ